MNEARFLRKRPRFVRNRPRRNCGGERREPALERGRDLGIVDGGDTARANPRHQARIVADLAKLTDFLTGLGVIDVTNRDPWVERGLAA